MVEISMDHFNKVEMKVGRIEKAETHPNADKLVVMKVSFGEEKRTIVAGLKKHYDLDQLNGKKAVFVVNLEPVNLRGVKSEGMILAAVSDEEVAFISPEKDIPEGSNIQ